MNRTKIAGVLNLTPDSFSDGGHHYDPTDALAHIQSMLEDGADIIDIGAESTRPGATPLSHTEEWGRLAHLPQMIDCVHITGKEISLDTRHPETARKAISQGVDWINDVSGLESDAMVEAVRGSDCKLVVMHALGVPADANVTLPPGCDPLDEINRWAAQKLADLKKKGIARERIILDPGIGFGKTPQQSLEILLRAEELKQHRLPVLIGHSRKSFLKLVTEKDPVDRDEATLGFSAFLMKAGVDYLRVHNVSRHVTLRNFLPSDA